MSPADPCLAPLGIRIGDAGGSRERRSQRGDRRRQQKSDTGPKEHFPPPPGGVDAIPSGNVDNDPNPCAGPVPGCGASGRQLLGEGGLEVGGDLVDVREQVAVGRDAEEDAAVVAHDSDRERVLLGGEGHDRVDLHHAAAQ